MNSKQTVGKKAAGVLSPGLQAVPPAEMLVKLADALDSSVDYILGRTDIKSTLRASELNEQEAEMLSILRKQPADKRTFVFDMIKGLEK